MGRHRSASEYEEQIVSKFVDSCVHFQGNVSFHALGDFEVGRSKHVLLLGTSSQLCNWTDFPLWSSVVESVVQSAQPKKTFGTLLSNGTRLIVGIIPSEASRYNSPSRPDVITALVQQALSEPGVVSLDIVTRCTEELCVAVAVAKGNTPSFSTKNGKGDDGCVNYQRPIHVYFAHGALSSKKGSLEIVAKYVQLCRRLVDAPTNLLDTVTFAEIAIAIAGTFPHCEVELIAGEELRERGYGGVYNVGKAAEFPPALLTLTYQPKETCGDPKVSLVGKGIVYDTGGLAIKTPVTSMCNMKTDMGGAAAVLCGFLAAMDIGVHREMSCTLCLADNAIGPRSLRNDDIILMKSGLSVEINNTDAEGRLVLGDGVFHASTFLRFSPDIIVEMSTLTGAQSIATGKKHAAIFVSDGLLEAEAIAAGKKSGDTVFPVLYCPEYHAVEFASNVADLKNLMAQTNNAGVSCAGHFITCHLNKQWGGKFLHVDLAAPSSDPSGGTGFGVGLFLQLIHAV